MRSIVGLAIWVAGALFAGSAEAYIGPGLGAGALAAVLGVIGSLFLALVTFVYYPIRRLLKSRKASAASRNAGGDEDQPDGAADQPGTKAAGPRE